MTYFVLHQRLSIMLLLGIAANAFTSNSFADNRNLSVAEISSAVDEYRSTNEPRILEEFSQLLSVPNDAASSSDIRDNARLIMQMMQSRGIRTELLDVETGSPAVFGELKQPGATKTIMFYVHYDGQPVKPEIWASPPYVPTLRTGRLEASGEIVNIDDHEGKLDEDWRLYARSASDDKAPIIGILTAIDAMRAADIQPSINLKFFFDGEEERGSNNIPILVEENSEKLQADAWIFCDGPVHQSGRKKLSFGARGGVHIDVTTYGPSVPVHSGHYGNWAPNAINQLVHLLASMRDIDGRVLIDGFYDDVIPPSEAELDAVANLPNNDTEIMQTLGLGWTESAGKGLAEAILWPALNFQGIQSGPVNQTTPFPERAKTVLVSSATVSIGVRLVPNQSPGKVVSLIEKHMKRQGYTVLNEAPTPEERLESAKVASINVRHWGYPGARTPIDLPISKAMIRIMNELTDGSVVLVPSSGGSLPIAHIRDGLNVPLIMLPIANYDNNQHAANENIRLGNLWDGMRIYAAVMAKVGLLLNEGESSH